MNKVLILLTALIVFALTGCSGGGITLKELSEMSDIERQQLTEIKLVLDLPEGTEFDFWKTFEGCVNLKKVEIDKNFKEALSVTEACITDRNTSFQ